MRRDIAPLSSAPFDLLIVGGGMYGLASAWDAALRGLRVGLVERDDFGAGTSFNHLKTIHGGLRYLQSGDIRRMRESILERRTIARIAPHLVRPLPFIVATRGVTTRSRLAMRVAFLLDAVIGAGRNDGVGPRLVLPRGRVLGRRACPPEFLGQTAGPATGGALWHDFQAPDTDRLTLAFALGAAREGAVIANYVEAVAPVLDGRRVSCVRARDRLSGSEFEIKASVILNAAGAGAAPLMAAMGVSQPVPLLKAMNVVTSRPAPPLALGSPTRDGRLLFLVPWRGVAVAGTSHSQELFRAGQTAVSEAELDAFLAEVNEAFPRLALARADVTLVHRGLVPAVRDRKGRLALRPHTFFRDHAADGVDNVVTVIGVKYTTGRGVAERAIDLVVKKLGRTGLSTRTRHTPLPGAARDPGAVAAALALTGSRALPSDVAAHLAESYGTEAPAVLALGDLHPEWLERVVRGEPVLLAEIVHAARHEMACHLSDAVLRRTLLGAARYPGEEAVRRAGEVMASELGWDSGRLADEMRAVREFYEPVEV